MTYVFVNFDRHANEDLKEAVTTSLFRHVNEELKNQQASSSEEEMETNQNQDDSSRDQTSKLKEHKGGMYK